MEVRWPRLFSLDWRADRGCMKFVKSVPTRQHRFECCPCNSFPLGSGSSFGGVDYLPQISSKSVRYICMWRDRYTDVGSRTTGQTTGHSER